MATLNKQEKEIKAHTYSEAIDLAGNGWYSVCLTAILGFTLLAMVVDLFSFATLVSFCSCEFHLTLSQKSSLLSIPFVGPVIMSYAWGYICDTKGRQKSLVIAIFISFLVSVLCAFSPNWIVLGILKLISTCCCSCAQSASGTLLGESCGDRVKYTYMVIMSSTIHLGSAVFFSLAYFVGKLDFFYDLGIITFVPWRFLALLFALPLGLSTIGLLFLYESPKFLLNVGREDEALSTLRSICRRNGGNTYPVQKVVLDEVGNVSRKDMSLLQSMLEQTLPLFKPPLLFHTVLLYYIFFVTFSANSALNAWLPFISKAFSATASSSSDGNEGLCSLIAQTNHNASSVESESCKPSIELPMLLTAIAYGCSISFINCLMCFVASRKKLLVTSFIAVAATSCLLTVIIPNKASNLFYFGVFTSSMCMGPVAGYFVDLYPTSFRGMAACLGVMVSRLSGIIGINVVGSYLTSHCSTTFYCLAGLSFSAVFACFFLPPDRPKDSPKRI